MDKDKLISNLKTSENLYLLPPHLSVDESKNLLSVWKSLNFTNHVFLCSSGTSTKQKIKSFALGKEALFNNARSVNQFLKANQKDVWLCPLPDYHVGGLSIYIRSILSNSKVINFNSKWSPKVFLERLKLDEVSLTSLVPAQLYDIVQSKLEAPKSLRAIFIGGDFLSDSILKEALKLGWPIVITYGATEICSQLASSFASDIGNGYMKVLKNHTVLETSPVSVKTSSLYTAQILTDDKNSTISLSHGIFELSDRVSIRRENSDVFIKPLGRIGDEFKINGKLVNLLELKKVLFQILIDFNAFGKGNMILEECPRAGKELVLVLEESLKSESLLIKEKYNAAVPRIFNLKRIDFVKSIKKTALGKFKT